MESFLPSLQDVQDEKGGMHTQVNNSKLLGLQGAMRLRKSWYQSDLLATKQFRDNPGRLLRRMSFVGFSMMDE